MLGSDVTARMRRAALPSALLTAAVLALGCGEFPDPGFLVTRDRVVGVRAELAKDPAQSRPVSGESLRVRALVVRPIPAENASRRVHLDACATGPDGGGIPSCAGPVLATVRGEVGDTVLELIVPPMTELHPEAPQLLIRGVLCVGGEPGPATPQEAPSCARGATDEERFFSIIPVLASEESFGRNRHPDLGSIEVTVDESPWNTVEADDPSPEVGCGESTGRLPVLRPKEEGLTRIRFPVVQREPTDDDGRRETLQLSHLVTAGDLGRMFSILDGPQPISGGEVVELDIVAPNADEVDPTGTLVRFTLVARDLRGGVARAEYAYCVVPE